MSSARTQQAMKIPIKVFKKLLGGPVSAILVVLTLCASRLCLFGGSLLALGLAIILIQDVKTRYTIRQNAESRLSIRSRYLVSSTRRKGSRSSSWCSASLARVSSFLRFLSISLHIFVWLLFSFLFRRRRHRRHAKGVLNAVEKYDLRPRLIFRFDKTLCASWFCLLIRVLCLFAWLFPQFKMSSSDIPAVNTPARQFFIMSRYMASSTSKQVGHSSSSLPRFVIFLAIHISLSRSF